MAASFARDMVAMLPRLRRFALSLTGKGDQADDLVQAACERALRAHESWEAGTSLDAWLFRIVRNLWIDQLRRNRTAGPAEPIEDRVDLSGSDGRDVTESRLMLAKVQEAMDTLTPEFRESLSLVCVEGLSYRETAEKLRVPIGTVMSRLARARQALAARLENDSSRAIGTQENARP